jgi:hypothetical protein
MLDEAALDQRGEEARDAARVDAGTPSDLVRAELAEIVEEVAA